MANEGDVSAASTTNIRLDGGKKNHKDKKHQKSNEEMLLDPTPSEVLTSHPPLTTEASDDEIGEEAIDITAGEEWVARVEVERQFVEILGRHMNMADGKFKTLEDLTLEETDNIRKKLEGRQQAEFEMKEAITTLECRLIEAHDKVKEKDVRTSHDKGGGDRVRGKENQAYPKQHDSYKSDGKQFGCQNYKEKKAQTTKRDGCYICGGPHGYARCPEMKNLGAILRERKEKDAQEQGQDAGMMQLGMVGLCGAIAKQTEKPRDFSTQYVDISINGRLARAMT
uniref:Uncharacterized protein n=1 Tax=Solanum tuberosum TaxID=4113 RepID=M1AFJ1_SOLTU